MAASRKLTRPDPVLDPLRECIGRISPPDGHVAIAFSGGVDSTVLLDATRRLQEQASFRLTAIHVHHGLQSAADQWVAHCQAICDAYGVPLHVIRVSVPADTGTGLEAAARAQRYAALDTVEADWILLGHHADDQAETVFHNLLRGSGVLGLAGMPYRTGRYERPLLRVRKADIDAYARERDLSWITDPSNADTSLTRNWLRCELLPKCEARFPGTLQSLAATADRMAEANGLLVELAAGDSAGAPWTFPFPAKLLQALSPARASNLLHCLLTANQLQTPASIRLKEFVRQLQSARPDRHPELRLGTQVLRYRHGLLHLILLTEDSEGTGQFDG